MANIRKHVARDGKITYRVQVRYKHRSEYATFTTKKDALDWAVKTEQSILNEAYFPEKIHAGKTLGEVIQKYFIEVLPAKSKGSQKTQRSKLEWWLETLGDMNLQHITTELIEKYKIYLWIEKQYNEWTVNSYLNALAHVFTMCCTWKWLSFNPCNQVKRLPTTDRLPLVTDKQFDLIVDLCKSSHAPYLYPFVIMALSTGGRRDEIMTLTWSQVDFKNKTVLFTNTKSKKDRIVPLNDLCISLLSELYETNKEREHVFYSERIGSHINTLQYPWYKVRHASGLFHLRIHDLRHVFASRLATHAKADIGTIAHLLGHNNLKHTRRYVHLTEQYTAQVIDRMSQAVFKSAQ